MKRLSIFSFVAVMLFLSSQAFALTSASLSYGGTSSDRPKGLKAYRAGLQWFWPAKWLRTKTGYWGGYWDVSVAHLTADRGVTRGSNRSLNYASVVPVFRWQTRLRKFRVAPYIELGIGGALISRTRLGDFRYSTAFQFDDRLGFGARFGKKHQFDIGLMYNHLSNGSIKRPNAGINIVPDITFRYFF